MLHINCINFAEVKIISCFIFICLAGQSRADGSSSTETAEGATRAGSAGNAPATNKGKRAGRKRAAEKEEEGPNEEDWVVADETSKAK